MLTGACPPALCVVPLHLLQLIPRDIFNESSLEMQQGIITRTFSATVCSKLEMSGNIFFNPILSHCQWLIPIPIPNPKFSINAYTCIVIASSVSWTRRVKSNIAVCSLYDKILCKKKGPLTVSDGQLPVRGKLDNVVFSFPIIPIQPFPFPLPFPLPFPIN